VGLKPQKNLAEKTNWLSKLVKNTQQVDVGDSLEQIARLSSRSMSLQQEDSGLEEVKSEVSSVKGSAFFHGELSVYATESEDMSEGELQDQREWAEEMGLASGDFPRTKKVLKK